MQARNHAPGDCRLRRRPDGDPLGKPEGRRGGWHRGAGNLDRGAAARYEPTMTRAPTPPPSGRRPSSAGAAARAERLKTALRANLGRRKAQARAKAGAADGPEKTEAERAAEGAAASMGTRHPRDGDPGTDRQG